MDWKRRWLRKGNVGALRLPKRADGWDTSSENMDLLLSNYRLYPSSGTSQNVMCNIGYP